MSKNELLRAKGLCKRFAQSDVRENILDHIDVTLYEGDFTIIMGASGAGKSTLLYALSGMDGINDGQVFYKDREISGYHEKQMAALRAEEFGFVFQQIHLVSTLTLLENVRVAGYLNHRQSAKTVDEKAKDLLEQLHIGSARDRLPFQTSGGEAQRAAIARALIHDPGLVFADEPTGALNKKNSEEILDLLAELNQKGQSILMVTHDLRAAIRGTRILYMEDGKILDELALPPFAHAEVKDRETTLSAWLHAMAW